MAFLNVSARSAVGISTNSMAQRALLVVAIAPLLAATVAARLWQLGTIPGMNGDEAQYGIYAIQCLRGEAFPLRTNTGNPLNPFFFLPQVVLHAAFSPSFALVRVPAVLSGLAALVANYVLAYRLLGPRVATVSTIAMAVLPINVVYSRFGWDSSQSLLTTTFVLYGSLGAAMDLRHRNRWLTIALLGAGVAVLVHPTNVFVLPLLGLALIWPSRAWWVGWINRRQSASHWWFFCAGTLLLGLAALAVFRHRAGIGSGGLPMPSDLWSFAINYIRLFSGVTVYRFISGATLIAAKKPPASTDWGLSGINAWFMGPAALDVAFLALTLVVAICWWRVAMWRDWPEGRFLAIGWLVCTAAFFLVAGPRAIAPHWERYGLCLIAPAAVLASAAIVRYIENRAAHLHRTAYGACLLGAWLLMGSFYTNYFMMFRQTGGRSHRAFRTASIEPKEAVLRYVLTNTPPGNVATIMTSDWWSYWPIRYLAMGYPGRVRVVRPSTTENSDGEYHDDFSTPEVVWHVEFVGTAEYDRARQRLATEGLVTRQFIITDFADRPLLAIMRPLSPAAAMFAPPAQIETTTR